MAVMLFGFVRVGSVVKMRVRDFDDENRNAEPPTLPQSIRNSAYG
jgi:hypothetical protein